MFGKRWSTSERKYGVVVENDVKIPTRDETVLNADIFRPDEDSEKFPAILGIHPSSRINLPQFDPRRTRRQQGDGRRP